MSETVPTRAQASGLQTVVADHSELAAAAIVKATTYGSLIAVATFAVRARRRR